MRDEKIQAMLFGNMQDRTVSSRGWTCPGDRWIAAYVDGVLGKRRKALLEFHLSACPRCRLLVADVVRVQRHLDLTQVPVALIRKAVGAVQRDPPSWRWIWVPVGALVSIALMAALAIVFREPGQVIVLSPPTVSAPFIAKSEPVAAPKSAVRDILRKPPSSDPVPTILFPAPNSVFKNDLMQFRWKPISKARYYTVRVVRSDGDLVSEGQTEKSTWQLPPEIAMKEGSYFVWVTADLADGRTAKSPPVRFLLKK